MVGEYADLRCTDRLCLLQKTKTSLTNALCLSRRVTGGYQDYKASQGYLDFQDQRVQSDLVERR